MSKEKLDQKNQRSTWKFLLFSFIGIFVFFISVEINGNSTIPLDHIVTGLETNFPSLAAIYALVVITIGAIRPFYNKSWNESKVETTFSLLKVLGFITAILVYIGVGPNWLFPLG